MDDSPRVRYAPGRYAALDIGTVTCRMLVADVSADGTLAEVDREYRITNLGEDVDATGVLKPQAMGRVRAAVEHYLEVLAACAAGEPVPLAAVATSAARDARNADEFADMLAGLGVRLSVIPGSAEAGLSFRGATSGFPGSKAVVVDIGGGSTEVVAGRAGAEPALAHSFNIGCRRVTEKFLHADPPGASELAEARAWIEQGMAGYFERLRAEGFGDARLLAVAGTATTVVSVREAMEVYDSSRVHGAFVSREDLDAVFARLAGVPLAQRERVCGLDPGRGPVIVAGLVILQTVLKLGGWAGYTACESDILEGIVLHAAEAASA